MVEDFRRRRPVYEQLLVEVLHSLNQSELLKEVRVHSIDGRVKELGSFLEKLERKNYSDPFRQTTDLVGARVVCLFIDDLDIVREAVGVEFLILESENKVDGADDTFGYMSHHFLCQIQPGASGRRYDGLKGITFELQCRTLLMDAWANVSHYLAYKGESSVPASLRRDFNALSGLLFVADRQFQFFYQGAMEARRNAGEAVGSEGSDDLVLDLDVTSALLKQEFPDRELGNLVGVSELVEDLAAADIDQAGTLINLMRRYKSKIEADERSNPPVSSDDHETATAYTCVGMARRALQMDSTYN
ncbi:GTP pyrophosphokinase [Actinomycetospora chiangmaiensis]|uniref:GTP pyrophosphokinase n=1 Tax=Actinomycetospora chiangmaiensis TaxID=402650 RepID=UPI0003A330F9|nr:hypothetical protein [Actinomycetospora chiangmaiensis]